MNRQHLVVLALVLALPVVWLIGHSGRVLMPVLKSVERPWPISDLAEGRPYRYGDFRKCQIRDGSYFWDWHFTGADRSLRNQLTPSGVQLLNDTSLPRGYMRVMVNPETIVEGHAYGGDRVVQFNGPIRSLYLVEACGPERGR